MYRIKSLGFLIFLSFVVVFSGCKKKESAIPNAGTIKNGVYNNEYFGLTLTLPENWSIQDAESSKELTKSGYKMIAGDDENLERSLNAAAEKQQLMFFSASKYPIGTPVADNPSIIGTAELVKSKPGIKRGSDYLFHVRNLLETSGIKITINETKAPEKFGGVEFDILDVVLPFGNVSVQQKYYSTVMKDYAISFILTYTSEEGEKYLQKILETAKFE
jgi:hypothetical protein